MKLFRPFSSLFRVVIALVLFVTLMPGAFFSLPGHDSWINFFGRQYPIAALFVHAALFAVSISLFNLITDILIFNRFNI